MKKVILICLVVVVVIVATVSVMIIYDSVMENQYLQKGNEYLEAEEYSLAISEYSQCINCNDENVDAYYGLAQAHYGNGALDTASAIAEIGYEKTQNFQLFYYIEFLEEEAEIRRIQELEKIGLPYYVKEAICAYYDLLGHDEITQEMIEAVTSVQLMLYKYETTAAYAEDDAWSDIPYNEADYTYYLEAVINDSLFGHRFMYIKPKRYEQMFMTKIEDDWSREKFNRFWTLKDPNDVNLTSKGIAEMYEKFPFIKETGAIYICDPDIKSREKRELNAIIDTYVYTDLQKFAVSKTVDLATLELLPNLQTVEYWIDKNKVESGFADIEEYKEYMGINFINCPVEIVEKIGDTKW